MQQQHREQGAGLCAAQRQLASVSPYLEWAQQPKLD
jgi:hypothetical protein